MEQARGGKGDVAFLKQCFSKLLTNFTWWVNRKDRFGKNVFEGGFLGLDNIGVFDRSAPLPTGGHLEQADGRAWMALFSQNMLELAIEIAAYDETYGHLAAKFVDHILWISNAMNRVGVDGMWDEEDGFYYDVLRLPDGRATRLKVRSIVGLLPLCAATFVERWQRERVPAVMSTVAERVRRRPDLLKGLHPAGPGHLGHADRGLVALVNPERLRASLRRWQSDRSCPPPFRRWAEPAIHPSGPGRTGTGSLSLHEMGKAWIGLLPTHAGEVSENWCLPRETPRRLVLSSSRVEHPAVNRRVIGSNPT
jgi:hypothetical protein